MLDFARLRLAQPSLVKLKLGLSLAKFAHSFDCDIISIWRMVIVILKHSVSRCAVLVAGSMQILFL